MSLLVTPRTDTDRAEEERAILAINRAGWAAVAAFVLLLLAALTVLAGRVAG